MSSKIKIISLGTFIIFLLFVLIFFSASKPLLSLKLNGDESVTIEVNSNYQDLGAEARSDSIIFKGKKVKIKEVSDLNISKLGDYTIRYMAKSNGQKKELTRNIKVVDTIAPEITVLTNEINVCKKNPLKQLSYVALDNYDGNITSNIKEKYTKDKLILTIKDSSGNKATKQLNYKIIDNEEPNITLHGNENIYITLGEEYIEYGAYAYDSCDGDISSNVKIVSNVNTQLTGDYTVSYEITDSASKTSSVTRNVHVIYPKSEITFDVPEGATIYLTFDDGPGEYTEQLLNILKTYDIKATFFVTNQFPKYQYMIKKEYEEGHTVGIHTYSHLWSIYESVDSYMNDFNTINQVIYNQTGKYSKIFRFPGGSSNTVSRKYCDGIITTLANKLVNEGYQYYDWSIDSTDTARKNTVSSIIENMKKQLKGNSYYIVLMHDIKKNTIEALPSIIEYAKSIGYQFKPITNESPIVHSRIAN